MNHFNYIFCLFFLGIMGMNGQTLTERPTPHFLNNINWLYDGYAYDLGMGEQHSYFSVTYKLNPQLHAELRGFYDTYRTSNVFDVSYRAKWYVSKKMYLYSGVGMQLEQSVIGPTDKIFRVLGGMGYDASKNLSIEAGYDYNFNFSSQSLNVAPNGIKIKGKYRF